MATERRSKAMVAIHETAVDLHRLIDAIKQASDTGREVTIA